MNLRKQSLTILPLIFLSILGVKILPASTSHAAPYSQTSNQILPQQIKEIEKFLLAAAGSCKVSMPNSSRNERLVLNVREVPNGDIVGTVDDGATVELETAGGIEGLYWVKIIKPVLGFVWTEHLGNCQ